MSAIRVRHNHARQNAADSANATGESDRSLGTRLIVWVLTLVTTSSPFGALNETGDRMAPAAKALILSAVGVIVASNPAAAQEYCDEGVGLLVADTQVMLWQIVLGMLVIIAMLGLILRAFPLFTGATAAGNLMIVGVIVGVIGFVFILTFIDFAFGVVGGPGIGEGCSPFL
ncbi:hypothetical protein [Saliphagus sp. LR7]|uniref:hypothetical protein n=1 Tax=Saliphagus sp. LR7 TaxID=2282654 RepID=UPI00130056BB|nr:hypothetical protein [Saliphagus sp. LR7]